MGSPREVFERPADVATAEFLGRSNLLPVRVEGPPDASPDASGTVEVHTLGAKLRVPAHPQVRREEALLLVRPHALLLAPPPQARPAAYAQHVEVRGEVGLVQRVLYRGDRTEYRVQTEAGSLLGTAAAGTRVLHPNEPVVSIDEAACWVLPSATGA